MESSEPKKIVFKVILCGSYAVGKTSLVFRFVEDAFQHNAMATIGANFLVKKFTFQEEGADCEVIMQLWDVSGTIREVHEVAEAFFMGGKCAFFVHDLTREWTRDDILDWHERVTQTTGEDILSMVVANKLDLVEETDEMEEASRNIAARIGAMRYFLTSAKTGQGVQKAFEEMAREYYRKVVSESVS